MQLLETVKSFFNDTKKEPGKDSSVVRQDNVLMDLDSHDISPNDGSFFDTGDSGDSSSLFSGTKEIDIITKQKNKIQKYRQLAMSSDVSHALDEIVNEIVFSYDDKIPLKIHINEENEKLVNAINECFNKIVKMTDLRRSFFQIVKRSYVDGQINMHCAYDAKNTKGGIKSIKMIDPCMFYFDAKSNKYKYMSETRSSVGVENPQLEYSIEEIVREDFGLYDNRITLSYLEYALKPANMLKTLEDLLVPLRFSRSISRRVFNVDIGDLPTKRGAELLRNYQGQYKYKKFYNNDTGEVTNQQHITSMVEDYWFANRSGGKGTQVDTLDETGNLGELDDILYAGKKLYTSLQVPTSRMALNPDADNEFDYDTSRVTREDMKFFMFISRLRQVYSSLFKEILKRQVISTGVMSSSEWDEKEEDIEVFFTKENSFIEKMKLDNFLQKLDIYATASEYSGKLFSVNTILRDVFRFTDEEIEEEFKKIQKEEKDPLYSKFYKEDDGY